MKGLLAWLLPTAQLVAAVTAKPNLPLIPIGELQKRVDAYNHLYKRDTDPSLLYPEHNFSVPIDHFHNETMYAPHSSGMFPLRYFFNDMYYKPGGPVIILQGGETDITGRLPYLQKGIVYELAKATGGMGVILEHRYYGTSFPTPDLSVKNLRFLTTDQALADMDYFARNIVFPGHEKENMTASTRPWIAYGGSYAGAFVAFLRKLYPETYWGAISSSGVTHAIYDYWKYYEPVRKYAPAQCVLAQQELQDMITTIFTKHNTTNYVSMLRDTFSMQNLTYDKDVVNTLTYGIQYWQSRNWDPAVNDPTFYEYCGNISSNTMLYSSTKKYKATVQRLLTAGGYGNSLQNLTNPMLNWINWNYVNIISGCAGTATSLDECYNTQNQTFYSQDDLSTSVWRSWPWQYCNQWGFLQTGSGVPKNQLPLLSRLIDLPYTSTICRDAFGINKPADTAAVNKHGAEKISYPRLAIIDGEADPWRPSTPHAPGAPKRNSTTEEPFIQISGAVHHWDENGLFPNETTSTLPPAPIVQVHQQEMEFVKAWIAEYPKKY